MKFKPGDRVVCVNNDGGVGVLTVGETYTVSRVDREYVVLEQIPYLTFYTWRFKLDESYMVKEMLKRYVD